MNILYLLYPLNAVIMLALAIGLALFLTRRFGLGWRLIWIGAAGFVLSQVGHIPFNALLTLLFQRGVLPVPPAAWQLPFNAVVLGLSAGLWEELTRYALFRWWARDARSWRKGLLMGAGHGGAEAAIVGVLVLFTFLQMVALRNVDLSTLVPPEQLALAQQQVEAYWSAPWYLALLAPLERLFALTVQVALAVLVLQTFTRGQTRWLWLAVGWHALLDAVAVYGIGQWGPYVTEALVAVFALASLGIIFALRRPEPPVVEEPEPPWEPPPAFAPREVEESPESLERTRYGS